MTDWVSVYYKSKKNNICKLALHLSNIITIDNPRLTTNKKRLKELLELSVDIYIDKHFLSTRERMNLNDVFIKSPYINEYGLSDVVSVIIEVLIKKGIILDIKNNENDIILLALLIKVSFLLNKLNNPFYDKEVDYNKSINKLLNLTLKIPYIKIKNKENINKLISELKNIKKREIKFFGILSKENSFNKYIRISETMPFYITQYNYYIKDLEKHNMKAVREVYNSSKYKDDFTFISLELAIITLIKEAASEKYFSTFLIPIKKDFFENDKNIKKLKDVLKYSVIKSKIKVLINSNDLDENLEQRLKKENIDYYIYCSEKSKVLEFKENNKYILSKGYNKKHQVKKQDNLLIETINISMNELDILFLKEKEQNINERIW